MKLSETVQQFIAQYISSVDQLEILLLLKREPMRSWNAGDVAVALATDRLAMESRLAQLAQAGLISEKPGNPAPVFQYGPRTPDLYRAVEELESAYPHFRVSIINLIFSKPIDKIRTFADAFRLKQEDEEDQ
jgi:hypothetical protein